MLDISLKDLKCSEVQIPVGIIVAQTISDNNELIPFLFCIDIIFLTVASLILVLISITRLFSETGFEFHIHRTL